MNIWLTTATAINDTVAYKHAAKTVSYYKDIDNTAKRGSKLYTSLRSLGRI